MFTNLPKWYKIQIICRLGSFLASIVLLTASITSQIEAQPSFLSSDPQIRLENHTVKILTLEQQIQEVRLNIIDLQATQNIMKGAGWAFGGIFGFLQLLHFLTDRKLKFVDPSKTSP